MSATLSPCSSIVLFKKYFFLLLLLITTGVITLSVWMLLIIIFFLLVYFLIALVGLVSRVRSGAKRQIRTFEALARQNFGGLFIVTNIRFEKFKISIKKPFLIRNSD
jgi:hypothetical protein